MTFYDHYANRNRVKIGEKLKIRQAEKIFHLAITDTDTKSNILELGPGDGYIAVLAKESGANYLGIEGSISVAQKLKNKGFNIIPCHIPPLPKGIGNFDFCFMLHIIEHFQDIRSAEEVVQEIRYILKPGGKLIIATPDYVRWGVDFRNCDYSHTLPFTHRRLKQLLMNTGFKIVYSDIYVGQVFGIYGLPLYWLAKVLYFRLLDDILRPFTESDIYYRGFVTFLPNLIVVAENWD